jgi:hypothetical protein
LKTLMLAVSVALLAGCAHRTAADFSDVLPLGGDEYMVTTYGRVWYTGADLLGPAVKQATAFCTFKGLEVRIGESDSAGVSPGSLTRGMTTRFKCVPK